MSLFLRTSQAAAILSAAFLLNFASAQAADIKSDTKVSGFGSFYYGQTLGKDILPYGFTDTKADFTHFSLIGADINTKLADDWTAGAEIVATGQPGAVSGYQAFAEWAFINYQVAQNTSIKMGRQRYPVFTASEYIETHEQLPFREMPALVFRTVPFAAFDGASVTQVFPMSIGKLSVGLFGGTPIIDEAAGGAAFSLAFSNLVGAKVTLDGDGWRARVQASSDTQTVGITGVGSWTTTANTYSAGYRYDKNNLVSWGEYVYEAAPDGPIVPALLAGGGKFLSSSESGYVLLGYRIDKFMPRYTYSQTNQALGIVNGSTTSHVLGVNYQASETVVAKLEVEYLTVPTAQHGISDIITQSATSTATSGSAVYAGVDFLF